MGRMIEQLLFYVCLCAFGAQAVRMYCCCAYVLLMICRIHQTPPSYKLDIPKISPGWHGSTPASWSSNSPVYNGDDSTHNINRIYNIYTVYTITACTVQNVSGYDWEFIQVLSGGPGKNSSARHSYWYSRSQFELEGALNTVNTVNSCSSAQQ